MEELNYENGGKEVFKDQIAEDIKLIQEDYGNNDPNLIKDEYAFNYWVLSRLYGLDEDIISTYITEYNDKGIDCFVYDKNAKELYIIQNKYYNDDTLVKRSDVADFLKTPLTALFNKKYKKSKELQQIFNEIYDDDDAQIWMHFYVTNDNKTSDIDNLVNTKIFIDEEVKAKIFPRFFTLKDIYRQYYGERFKEKKKFEADLTTRVSGTTLAIRPEDYNLPWMINSRFALINVVNLFNLYEKAKNEDYQLFEDNVREFLGKGTINNGIMTTLESEKDRENFFYYNNGITLICTKLQDLKSNEAKKSGDGGDLYGFRLTNPQIVNGCQTINSIHEVLSRCRDKDRKKEYERSYVLVKIYVFDENTKKEKEGLDERIVRYTNSQNGIDDKAFAANINSFENIQKEFKRNGFLLLVKNSDKNKFSSEYGGKNSKTADFKTKGKKALDKFGIDYTNLKNHMIPLEKMLKVLLAFEEGGQAAFVRGSYVLKRSSEYYRKFSLNVIKRINISNMINLYYFFLKADNEKKASADGRTPIPYYLLGFLGKVFGGLDLSQKNAKLAELFNDQQLLDDVYAFYVNLISRYAEEYRDKYEEEGDYNLMIKREIDDKLLTKLFDQGCRDTRLPKNVKVFLKG